MVRPGLSAVITAQALAEDVGEMADTLVTPTIAYDMARHHLAFAGLATLAPSTFILVIKGLVDSFTHHGFTQLVFLNGHGGNMAPLTTAFNEIKDHDNNIRLKTINQVDAMAGILEGHRAGRPPAISEH